MSLSDVFRDRHYAPGYVYIAGSLSAEAMKIGVTGNINQQQKQLRAKRYGGLNDWVLLYYAWVDEGSGRTEHEARGKLKDYRVIRFYKKDGSRQRGREIVACRFGLALEALTSLLTEDQVSSAWKYAFTEEYEFGWQPVEANMYLYFGSPAPIGIPLDRVLLWRFDSLDFSVRLQNFFRDEGIRHIGQLVVKSEADLLRSPNFGRKCLVDVKDFLARWGLHLAMDIPEWPPQEIETLWAAAEPFFQKVGELDLSVAVINHLLDQRIFYVGQLVQKSELELRGAFLGPKSVMHIQQALAKKGTHFGAELPRWR
jgi:hypothetical protein